MNPALALGNVQSRCRKLSGGRTVPPRIPDDHVRLAVKWGRLIGRMPTDADRRLATCAANMHTLFIHGSPDAASMTAAAFFLSRSFDEWAATCRVHDAEPRVRALRRALLRRIDGAVRSFADFTRIVAVS